MTKMNEKLNRGTCQLTYLRELGIYSKIDLVLEILKRNLRRVKQIVLFLKTKLFTKFSANTIQLSPNSTIPVQIKVGDIIKIRSKTEIKNLLNNDRKYKGCPFMEEMYEHCDKKYQVTKEIEYFYDEVGQKLCRTKNLVILDGVVCGGKKRLYHNSCDLNCYFFWHKDFLIKI